MLFIANTYLYNQVLEQVSKLKSFVLIFGIDEGACQRVIWNILEINT